MGRRASREMAMKLLFQFEFQKEDIESQKKLFLKKTMFLKRTNHILMML